MAHNTPPPFICGITDKYLRKHIRAHHPPVQRNAGPFSCPRCIQGFPTKNDLDDHLRRPDVCHITFDQGGADPEDGITQKIIVSLEARTLRLKIDNWTSLWRLLFPEDRTIPDPGKHSSLSPDGHQTNSNSFRARHGSV